MSKTLEIRKTLKKCRWCGADLKQHPVKRTKRGLVCSKCGRTLFFVKTISLS